MSSLPRLRVHVPPAAKTNPDRPPPTHRLLAAVFPGIGYTDDEVEFIKAVDKYRREESRVFPTCTELLRIAKSLGYRKPTPCKECGGTMHPHAFGLLVCSACDAVRSDAV